MDVHILCVNVLINFHVFLCLIFEISRGTPVSTSLGFCITLIPLLAMDLGSIFGNQEDYFIRNVPESELSTPEEYLKSMVVSSSDHPTDSSSDEDDDVEENALNEETPLLA